VKSLIVTAHPEPNSYGGAMMRTIRSALVDAGREVRLLDLYAENFDPVVRQSQFPARKDPIYFETMAEQAHQSALDVVAADVRRSQDLLLWADELVLQFPLWWWSLPALMKGWIDRVLSMGFAYGGRDLAPRRAMVCVTAETSAEKFAVPADAHPLQHIERGILKFCGFRVLPAFVIAGVWNISHSERTAKLDELAAHIKRHFASEVAELKSPVTEPSG